MTRFGDWLLIAMGGLLASCDDGPAPVDVPFSAAPLGQREQRPTVTADDSASAEPPPPPPPKLRAASGLESCCAELNRRSTFGTAGSKKLHRKAAGVCSRNSQRVREGRMTKAKAMAAVRSSMLGAAPANCR